MNTHHFSANKIEKFWIPKIQKYQSSLQRYSDIQLAEYTKEVRTTCPSTLTLSLPRIFALCREHSRRLYNKEHFQTQLIGGVALYFGQIIEMKTGEGKTLVAPLSACLHAHLGRKVHIITSNDYLAKRDADALRALYESMGFTVGTVLSAQSIEEKRKAYDCDVVYVTNTEIGFDFLRDNMSKDITQQVVRDMDVAIIDEADSILIDEARMPLIVTQLMDDYPACIHDAYTFVQGLETQDFCIERESKSSYLTELGIEKLEEFFAFSTLSLEKQGEILKSVNNALHVQTQLSKDREYIRTDDSIVLIDEHTGRIAENRRLSNGLHQAIEAFEQVPIKPDIEIQAMITYQNLFKEYQIISGMSGTVATEAEEFKDIYGLFVVTIPTNNPVIRRQNPDKLYRTLDAKISGIVKDVARNQKKGRPVLVGTLSIQSSEQIAEALTRANIPFQLLNAKNHELEASIIEKAGVERAVTVATNMAGRGTDICLSPKARELGGLKVIGVERGANRRIDNQLCGRSGRQGDPGVAQFYLSLEDELIRYVPERTLAIISHVNKSEQKPIKHKQLDALIPKCQKLLEGRNATIRKETAKYDIPFDQQRKAYYKQRQRLLSSTDPKSLIQTLATRGLQCETTSSKIIESVKLVESEAQCSRLRCLVLELMDEGWSAHIEEMLALKNSVQYDRNPYQTFEDEGHKLFDLMIDSTVEKVQSMLLSGKHLESLEFSDNA